MKMELSSRLLAALIAFFGLVACTTQPREGPPAPIVQATPRELDRSSEPEPRPGAPKPEAAPAKPVDRGTKVYAYQDPGAPPEPEPAEAADKGQVEPAAPTPMASPRRSESATPAQSAEPGLVESAAKPPAAPAPASTPGPSPSTPTTPMQPKVADAVPEEPRAAAPPASDSVQSTPRSEAPSPVPQTASAAPAVVPDSSISAPDLPPAAQALARQAEQQRQAGDYTGAAASLERSLRISPREAYLWNRLARVRMEQGQSVQAGNLASRSNDLAGSDTAVKKDNWRIIAEAKRRAGDLAGAGDAERRASAD